MSPNEDEVLETVQLANRITKWLRAVGAETTGAGVDLADCIAAGKHVESLLVELLALQPASIGDTPELQRILAELHVWLFGELRPHLDHLAQNWEVLEDLVAPDTGCEYES